MDTFLWSEASKNRNKATQKHEPLQPFLFLGMIKFSGANVVIDIGANVGYYSLMSSLSEDVDLIYSFEPDSQAFIELERNIYLNSLSHKIKPFKAAVSSSTGIVSFGSHSPMSGVNGIVETSIHEKNVFSELYDIETVVIDSIESLDGNVLAIKIDVEGHELQVIEGAQNILRSNPAIIQVEHYLGSGIDQKLNELGYFCFFVAGHDYYFTNIENFVNKNFVNRMLQFASSWLIEYQSGRLPRLNTIRNSLSVKCHLHGSCLKVDAFLKDGFFNDPEFAYYLFVDGVKADGQWYNTSHTTSFSAELLSDAKSVEVKVFVRESSCEEKKFAVSSYVKQPPIGYRASSAIENSYGSPSEINTFNQKLFRHERIDINSVLSGISNDKISNAFVLGELPDFDPIIKALSDRQLSVVCTYEDQEILKKGFLSSCSQVKEHPSLAVYSVQDKEDFSCIVEALNAHLSNVGHVLLLASFLNTLNIDLDDLSPFFTAIKKKSNLYVEKLTNVTYRDKLEAIALRFDFNIVWLGPCSRILSLDKLIGMNSTSLYSSDHYLKDSCEFNFDNIVGDNFERSIGLNFSL